MAVAHHIYGEVNNKTSLMKVFRAIRGEVDEAHSRPALTELYKRAGYLITLTHAPSWKERFGSSAEELRETGKEEFRKTAKRINRRARQIGTEPDYDETWGNDR